MINDKEYRAFHEFLVRNCARFNDVLQRQLHWMPPKHRELVVAKTLEIAWTTRNEFDPNKEPVTHWFERAVFAARQMKYESPKPERKKLASRMDRLYDDPPKTLEELIRECRQYRPLTGD